MAVKMTDKEGSIRIAHFGAFDMESMGDTMFPVIFRLEMEKRFGDRLEIDLYAPNGANHPYNNLARVFPIDSLVQRHAKNAYCALVVGGGEFIHFRPISYRSPDGEEKQYNPGELWKKPQEIAEGINLPVIWNCVGVGRDFENGGEAEQVRQVCEELSYLSVRDAYSRIRLQNIAVVRKIYQVPDMLWLLRRYIQPGLLNDCFRQLKKEYRFLNQGYLVLQYGTSLEYGRLAKEVQKISTDYGLAVLLLTVNYCHEDQEVSDQLQEVCREFYIMGRKLQPKEIMAVIAHAKFFLGTSLHGNITAMSYGVKNLCLDMYQSCVGKLDGLFEMMQMQELLVRDIDSLRGKFDQQMRVENRGMVAEKAALFQEELKCHFDRIAGLLQESADIQKKDAKSETKGTEKYRAETKKDSTERKKTRAEKSKDAQKLKRQYRFIKSVLSDGKTSTGCNSMMELDSAIEGSQSLELEFQVQRAVEAYQGKFYYPNPFLVESMEASENGKPASCSLEGMMTGSSGVFAVYKDCCRFSVRANTPCDAQYKEEGLCKETLREQELCRREAYREKVLLKVHIRLRDAWHEYMEALEGQVQRDAQELLNRQGHIGLLLESERKLSADKKEKQNQIDELIKKGQRLRQELEKKQECLDEALQKEETLKKELKSKQECLDAYEQAGQKRKQEMQSKQEYLEACIQAEQRLKQEQLEACAQAEQQLKQELLNKQGHIELLLETEREFERVKKSRTWRLAFKMQQLSAYLVPPGSARRLLIKLFLKFVRHPIQFIKKLTPSRIRNFFRLFREEGSEYVSKRIDMSMPEAGYEDTKFSVNTDVDERDFSEYAPLMFPPAEEPDVSIIIPVYNQFSYTYNCLKSILDHSGSTIRYEIIVADDCSSDDTRRLGEVVKNVRVLRNEKNLLFLKNCNQAAFAAQGRYLLFLNNDTQVQENWLEPLVRLMERSDRIGMTGSKLIYPDGKLQEAGGIIWRDGSAWNYGNRQEADRPEYNYVKEVDYISGASLMIRKKLWKEIGGFDERYAPAYCEDSDLAFEVRKRGYQVVYQPQSVVVHFEGISNGTETDRDKVLDKERDIKHYQKENSQKLRQKWADVLENHNPNAYHVFRARERSQGKPVILFIDHYIPQYDKDAGSRTIYQYMRMFIKRGFQVKFIGDNFYRHEPYASQLEQMGIEILYGSYYQSHVFEWLDRNHKEIDFVFLNRPHISVKYIDFFYEKTDIKIIYYGLDLHFLRIRREYELTGERGKLREASEWKKKELYLMQRADVSYYPSPVEIEEIHSLDAAIPAKTMTIFVYDRFLETIPYDFSKREGILFVGGFVHEPNIDAVRWFVGEILPLIRSKKEIAFYVVGSNAPKEILAMDGRDGVCVKGFLSDEELSKLYAGCRIAVIPLRYGAGVKGKVIEALYNGVPVVTTSIGAEGIPGIEEVVAIQDQSNAFADKVVRLYDDLGMLAEIAKKTQVYVKEHFSMDAVWKSIEDDFRIEKRKRRQE